MAGERICTVNGCNTRLSSEALSINAKLDQEKRVYGGTHKNKCIWHLIEGYKYVLRKNYGEKMRFEEQIEKLEEEIKKLKAGGTKEPAHKTLLRSAAGQKEVIKKKRLIRK